MKLFLISQDENTGYDTYESAVVCAVDEQAARMMCPQSNAGAAHDFTKPRRYSSWCSSPEKVKVELIGDAVEGMQAGVVCASFNAG